MGCAGTILVLPSPCILPEHRVLCPLLGLESKLSTSRQTFFKSSNQNVCASKRNFTNGFQKQKIDLALFDHDLCYILDAVKNHVLLPQHNTVHGCQNKLVLPLEKQYRYIVSE